VSRRDVKAGTGLHGLELSGASVNEIENSSVLGSGDSVHMAGRNRDAWVGSRGSGVTRSVKVARERQSVVVLLYNSGVWLGTNKRMKLREIYP